MSIKPFTVTVPADIPHKMKQAYTNNYLALTKNTGNLLLFTCDHKVEHLNTDFYGTDIHPDAMHPGHIFEIAAHGAAGALATHGGLIARYGLQYPSVNYVVKLNGKTNLGTTTDNPHSAQLYSVEDVMKLQQSSGLAIRGIGITVYLGSAYETEMLEKAAHAINQAHQHGLVAIVWIYLKGTAIADNLVAELIAGIAGVGVSLGADFIKIKPPVHAQGLRIATIAAGNSKIICAGGNMRPLRDVCQTLYEQIHVGGTAGAALGRTIFQCSRQEAIARTVAFAAIIHDQVDVETALEIYAKKIAA